MPARALPCRLHGNASMQLHALTLLVLTRAPGITLASSSNQRRHSSGGATNPYDVGLLRNCASVWCVPVPPSKIDYRCVHSIENSVVVAPGHVEQATQGIC